MCDRELIHNSAIWLFETSQIACSEYINWTYHWLQSVEATSEYIRRSTQSKTQNHPKRQKNYISGKQLNVKLKIYCVYCIWKKFWKKFKPYGVKNTKTHSFEVEYVNK